MKPLRVAAVTQCTLDSFNSGGIGAADGALGRHAFRATLWPPVGEESRHSLSSAASRSLSYARTHAFGMSRASPQSAVESPPCIRHRLRTIRQTSLSVPLAHPGDAGGTPKCRTTRKHDA